MNQTETEKSVAARAAVQLVGNNLVVGLGTGSTAYYVIHEIARRVAEGLQVRAIPTSEQSKALATELGIPLIDINTVDAIDITIDGADEFTEDLMLIKGGGGALLREKIVASITRQQIIIADSTKRVSQLGKFKLPVEVIPFAANLVQAQLKKLGGHAQVRTKNGSPFITDEGNHILDTDFGLIANPVSLSAQLKSISGVVDHGLFIGLAHKVIMVTDQKQ